MRFSTLQDWLDWQETLHPRAIDLGLERVSAVLARLQPAPPAQVVISVAGTNGKGSSVALLEAILTAAGYRVGAYTSPHLLRYNERIRINGQELEDTALCEAFARVDAARGEISLSYFEFGTLAALDCFAQATLDAVILEVGLGGRLDAVNVRDADAALVTSVDMDHMDWLGEDREAIGREKAGIFRPGRPAVCADPRPPASVQQHARALAAQWMTLDEDFGYQLMGEVWCWWGVGGRLQNLPVPPLEGEHQLRNAAGVLQVLGCLDRRLPVTTDAIADGLRRVQLPARVQRIEGPVERILDVAHNPHALRALADVLATTAGSGACHLVIGMLADKDAAAAAAVLVPVVDRWYLGGLDCARGVSGAALEQAMAASLGDSPRQVFASVGEAYAQAMTEASEGDRVVVCGSFYAVAEVLSRGL